MFAVLLFMVVGLGLMIACSPDLVNSVVLLLCVLVLVCWL